MAGDNFDLQGWMREQKQGPYTGAKGVEKVALKSSKPKSKTGLNEGIMGMIDLQPVGHLSEEFTDDDFAAGMNDEEDLDNYFNSYPEDNELGDYSDPISGVTELDMPKSIILKYLKDNYPQLKRLITFMVNKDEMDVYEMVQLALSKLDDSEQEKVFNHFKSSHGKYPGEGEEDYYDSILSEDNELGEAKPSAKVPSMPINQKWDLLDIEAKEGILDYYDENEEGLADYAYMGWAMVPDEVKQKIGHLVINAPVSAPEEDEDEKTAAMAMKQAKKGAKAVKGLNPEKDIRDLLYGDDEDDFDM